MKSLIFVIVFDSRKEQTKLPKRNQHTTKNWNKLNEYDYKVEMMTKAHFFYFLLVLFVARHWNGLRLNKKLQNLPRNFRSSDSCRSMESLHSRSLKTSIFNSAEKKKNRKSSKKLVNE